ncbi:MAG TPA: nickel pincer cofactor biosynthesis protein LarC, partial [Opitutaceae bacterium]|nr:nickel pincer cofactor biosynthesis protein LarC [Opitutaceae bacterium]
KLQFTRDARKGIGGTRADVILDDDEHEHHDSAPHSHPHAHTPGAHSHTHSHEAHTHEHRAHRDIVAMIERSSLAPGAKRRALAIFAHLAQAEAKIHGVSVDDVAFHEVGAADSIIDIVGAAIALDWLKPDRVYVSAVELGGGFVKCAHGRLSVPAPATAELLRSAPVRLGAAPFETTTPTGAAILIASADGFTNTMDFAIERVGYGIGHKDGPIPNLLRVFLASRATAPTPAAAAPATSAGATAIVLECNLDDMTGETAGYVLERLLAAGAGDAWITPILMKKSRPAMTLSALCAPEREAALTEIFLRETTTLGLRRREVGKLTLERTTEEIATSFGPVRVKTGWLDGRRLKSKPEHDDLRRIATERGLPLLDVEHAVRLEIARQAPTP